MTFKELKCPNCTAPVKVSGNLATCTRCGSNFLLDIPVITPMPIQETKAETKNNIQQLPNNDIVSSKNTTGAPEKTSIKLTPIAHKAINWTAILIFTILIWIARIWAGLGILTLIALLSPSKYSTYSSDNTVAFIVMCLIFFALPSFVVHRFSSRRRDGLLETDSVIETRQENSTPEKSFSSATESSFTNKSTNSFNNIEQSKSSTKTTKPTKRQIKSVRIPHGFFGKANTRKIERTSKSLMQKGYSLTHQNDQPARGCAGSGYTLLTFIKD